ncbi:MAG TPA: NADH-quinone oxidoreductase subunit J [Thermoanaerobaculia bacterium]|nr:NADH-quinone oxidoreductase subunit J [Thermoanaerobaculia bacterium]
MSFLAANGSALLFYVFAALAVVAALGVVTLRNPMYGAIALLLTFLSVAVLFLLRHAEFLAMVQIFVYGGGIMVLFLFVIMLVNLHRLKETRLYWGQSPAVLVLGVLLLLFFGYFFVHAAFGPAFTQPQTFVRAGGVDGVGNSQAVAWSLYRDYLLPFEVASLFLLIAMIGAVVLGRRQ